MHRVEWQAAQEFLKNLTGSCRVSTSRGESPDEGWITRHVAGPLKSLCGLDTGVTGRRTMLDLVFWSFSVSLAPWALGLAWHLIFGVARPISPTAANASVAFPGGRHVSETFCGPSWHGISS